MGTLPFLREKYFAPSERDLEALENQFFDNNEEPVLLRSEAGFILAISNWTLETLTLRLRIIEKHLHFATRPPMKKSNGRLGFLL